MKEALIAAPFAASGALSEATATIIEKNILRKRKIDYKAYAVYGFLVISLLMLIFLLFTWKSIWRVDAEALELKNILILLLIIGSSAIANLLIFYAMKWEKMTEIEPLRLFQPLLVIIFAYIFYSSERQIGLHLLIASLIAASALIFSHIKREHFSLNKYAIATLVGSLLFAIELAASNLILKYYSSLSFYFIRCSIIFIAIFIFLKPKPNSIDKKSWFYMTVASVIWIVYRMLLYFGYSNYGVIFTTLLFILAPVFIYLFSYIYLKERPSKRNIISAIIIVACVAYAIFVGK